MQRTSNVVFLDGQEMEDMDGFDYLGARLTKHGGTGDGVKSSLGKLQLLWHLANFPRSEEVAN